MPFKKELEYAAEVGPAFGEYLTTFISEPKGEARADIFRRGSRVDAWVSFPTGLRGVDVTESFESELWQYAREQGFADHFHVLLPDN